MPKKVLYGICKECAKCYQRSAVYEDNLEGLMGQYLSNCAPSPPLTQKINVVNAKVNVG